MWEVTADATDLYDDRCRFFSKARNNWSDENAIRSSLPGSGGGVDACGVGSAVPVGRGAGSSTWGTTVGVITWTVPAVPLTKTGNRSQSFGADPIPQALAGVS